MHSFITAQMLRDDFMPLHLPEWALGLQVYQQGGRVLFEKEGFSDDMCIHTPSFPFSSFGYSIPFDSPLDKVISGFKLQRLANVGQLGFLTPPTDHARENLAFQRIFDHTRFNHSLDVAALAALMLANAPLDDDDKRCGVAGALLHDLLMPAGGDTTKLLDKVAFDEDANFTKLLETPAVKALCQTYGLVTKDLDAVVQEESLAGKIKNIADKLAYVCRDAQTFLNSFVFLSRSESCRFRDLVQVAITCQPFIGDLWEDVRIIDGEVVFSNAARLSAFLMLRAIMFRDLYYNPYSRGYEFLVYMAAMQPLYEAGILTPENLLSMSDLNLHDLIRKELGLSREDFLMNFLKQSRHEIVGNEVEAQARVEQLKRSTPFAMYENFQGWVKPCTDWRVVQDGIISPLEQVLPTASNAIKTIASMAGRIMVHWIQDPHPELIAAYERLLTKKPA